MKKLMLIISSIFLINITDAIDTNNDDWELTDSAYGNWFNIGTVYGCSNWKPSKSMILKDEVFNQTSDDCKQNIKRTVQDRFKNKKTKEYKNSEILRYQNAVKIIKSNRDNKGTSQCIYTSENVDLPMTYWLVIKEKDIQLYMIVINSKEVKSGSTYGMDSTIINGTNYHKGLEIKKTISGYKYSYYGVCK